MLLKYILRPLASCASLCAVVESQSNTVTISFESVMSDLEHPSPSDVFAKIKLVLEVLQKQLLGMCFCILEKLVLFLKVSITLK